MPKIRLICTQKCIQSNPNGPRLWTAKFKVTDILNDAINPEYIGNATGEFEANTLPDEIADAFTVDEVYEGSVS